MPHLITRGGVIGIMFLLLAGCSTPPPVEVTNIARVTPVPAQRSTSTSTSTPKPTNTAAPTPTATPTSTPTPTPNPLNVEWLRQQSYPGSELTIEQELPRGSNYRLYIASYKSDGLKIFGLLTIPEGEKPATGWPAIIFNHGFIPPNIYRTTERYVAYVDAIARSGYVVFKPDYRGHGNSEGEAVGGYASPAYTVDSLNALASVKKLPEVDPNRLGMWGHSMGGMVTLRSMVISKDIKAGVIWGGVVASYADLLTKWRRPESEVIATPPPGRRWRTEFVATYGTPEENPDFWNSISPITFVNDISGPVQLDHSTTDEEVPFEFSQTLNQALLDAGKVVEFYSYPGDNHNIANNFSLAMQRSIAFFDRYVKGE